MGNTFTRENVEAAFQSILAEFGADHLYERQVRPGDDPKSASCYYTVPEKHDGKYVPSCIVGHIIDKIDPDLLQIIGEQEDTYNTSCGADAVFSGTWGSWSDEEGNVSEDERTVIEDDNLLIIALSYAQDAQDDGKTWGQAYESFRAELSR